MVYSKIDSAQKIKWVSCPYCKKKAFMIFDDTKIHRMPFKCRGSNCKREFIVNIE